MSAIKEKRIQINKRLRNLPREELEKLSKSELIDKIVQLEAYNFQLKNILQKKLDQSDKTQTPFVKCLEDFTIENNNESKCSTGVAINSSDQHTTKVKRKYNFNKVNKRHVLLKILYFGWDYQGFASQEDSNETIEYHIFKALERTCLIESRATSNYHRCGRTDKEVSAFCQVISIDLRSNCDLDPLLEESIKNEIDYCGILNRILPKNIQCVAWMPLRNNLYSARFDCTERTYRYYFPKGDLNIQAIREACMLLKRHADFRNFCKMDVHNGVTNYIRNLQEATVHKCPNESENEDGYTMFFLEIKANAFLWHQIRCIMAILLLIGQGKEEPQVVSDLLDVETNACKPQYTPAIGLPLNLYKCEFRKRTTRTRQPQGIVEVDETPLEDVESENSEPSIDDTTQWIFNEENLQKLIENIQSEWAQFSIKSTMIRNVLHSLEATLNESFGQQITNGQVLLLQDCIKPRQYQKLLTRKRCESLNNRIEHFVKKQRLVVKDHTSDEVKST